jgi:ubiquitin-like-conjugating enzyme ATG3
MSGAGSAGGTRTGSGNQYTIPDIDDDDEERQAKLRQLAQSSGGGGGEGGGGGGNIKAEEEERIPDISDLDLNADQNEDDDAVAPLQPATTTATPSSGVLACRTYDLLISYDNYYHVPRFWLIGYNEDRTPLTQKEVLEDVMSDYFSHKERKTVSVESHPHRSLGGKVVSIHPCKHAETMHRLAARISGDVEDKEEAVTGEEVEEKEEENVDRSNADGGLGSIKTVNEFNIEHYMVLFLKFISSVVPTIEYDYTMPAGM